MVRNVLGLTVGMTFPDANGVVRGVAGTVPGLGDTMLALREDPVRAGAAAGFDPIAFRVGTGGLTAWANHLDKLGINHTPPITALGIVPVIARRKTENGSGLGTKRWPPNDPSPGSTPSNACAPATNAAPTSTKP